MAELNNQSKSSGRGVRAQALPRVDLTAMVDLAFLLITFFMLTTTLAKARAMKVTMPDKSGPIDMHVSEARALTICLGKDNKLEWYRGTTKDPIIGPVVSDYSSKNLRNAIIVQSKAVVKMTGNPAKGLIVLIKPSDKSVYKNLVNVLDEMEILKMERYAIVDITKDELKSMEKNGIY